MDDNSRQAGDKWKIKKAEEIWLECLNDWYPDRHKLTYFLPPLHFKRVPCKPSKLCCGKDIEILSKPHSHDLRDNSDPDVNCVSGTQLLESDVRKKSRPKIYESDLRDDEAQERVLFCLQELFKVRQEPMMVISQLKYGEYLNKPTYAAAVKSLPTSRELNDHKKGDFDVLIIHKKYGLITGEVKSVSNSTSVDKRVDEAVDQLHKAEEVLTHLVSDLPASNLNIMKTVILPNITSKELVECLKTHEQTAMGLRKCLGAPNDSACVAMCLCDLVDRKTLGEDWSGVLERLGNWWDHLISSRRFQDETSNTSIASIYDRLLARFCGPATTISVHCVQTPRLEVRTKGDGVSETGRRIAQFVLFPEQVELLSKLQPLVFLSGPPGTGKTVLLIITGLSWLQKGIDVYVVSTSSKSRAASYVIEHQLKETLKEWTQQDVGKVNLHHFDLTVKTEVNSAVECLVEASKGQGLSLLADEIGEDIKNNISDFCRSLKSKVPYLQIWTASIYHKAMPRYLEFADEKLTLPLRSPPVVIREVEKAAEIDKYNDVPNYKESGFPTSTDGPQIERITHHEGQSGHTGSGPLNCIECGRLIAKLLKELHVGKHITTPREHGARPPPLQYRDVLILCYDYPLSSNADGLVQGLGDVPVRMVESSNDAIRDMALALTNTSNSVSVAHWDDVYGLERKIVVVMAGNGKLSDVYHRLRSASRCTSQLVWVDVD